MAVVSLFVAVIVICRICLSGKFYCDTKSIFFILGASIFTIVPETQYVYVNDTVTFECATNVTESRLIFVTYPSVNGSVSSSPGMISFTLTATSEVNGTNVTCNAYYYYSIAVATTEPAYLYVQGQYNTFIYCISTIISYLMGNDNVLI